MFEKFLKFFILILIIFSVNSYTIIFEEDLCICEKGNFSFKLPQDDWNYTIVNEATNQENFIEVTVNLSFRRNQISSYNNPIIKILREHIDAIQLEHYFNTIPYHMQLPSKNYIIIDTGSTVVDGYDAKWLVLKYNPGYPFDENYTEMIKQVYITKDLPNVPIPVAYIITYISDEEYYGNYYDIFEKIIESFKLL